MAAVTWTLVLALLFCLQRGTDAAADTRIKAYEDLVKEIQARKINPLIPPFPDEGPVTAELSFKLHRVINLQSDSAILSLSGIIRVGWKDPRLAWKEPDRPDFILLPASSVWIPEFTLESSATFSIRKGTAMLMVNRDGSIVIEKNIQENVACEVNVRLFPRDIQHCSLVFIPAISYRGIVTPLKHVIVGENVSSNVGEEWSLLSCVHRVEGVPVYHGNASESEDAYVAGLLLSRNHAFYFLTIIIPTLMLALMTMVPFAIPPTQCGPKLVIPVTTFLSFNIYMLLLEKTLPKTSSLPVLGQSYAAMLLVGLITELSQAISIKFYSCHIKRIPKWLAFLYFRVLACLCCFRTCHGVDVVLRRDDDYQISSSDRKRRLQKSWTTMGRINDRVGLCLSLVVVVLALVYLFVNIYQKPKIPEVFRGHLDLSGL